MSPTFNSQFSLFNLKKDRPLPKRGCSVAFFIFFALLVIVLIVYYIIYKHQPIS
ncbi:MAG: hypothetical protein J6X88_09790 [Bacteroidales bacterium]|nr:hypothetical protein [Bacteroidales bacterium]